MICWAAAMNLFLSAGFRLRGGGDSLSSGGGTAIAGSCRASLRFSGMEGKAVPGRVMSPKALGAGPCTWP